MHSAKISYDTVRLISFKLANKINMEDLSGKEEFTFERYYRLGDEEIKLIECKILGTRKPRPTPVYGGTMNSVQLVEISGAHQCSVVEL